MSAWCCRRDCACAGCCVLRFCDDRTWRGLDTDRWGDVRSGGQRARLLRTVQQTRDSRCVRSRHREGAALRVREAAGREAALLRCQPVGFRLALKCINCNSVPLINPTFHVREQNPSGCWGFAHRSSLHGISRRYPRRFAANHPVTRRYAAKKVRRRGERGKSG